jgi:dTMP kinase
MILKKGFLVAIEGIDGAGKTTQTRLLSEYLERRGFDVVSSKEPTNSIYGLKIRKLAQGERAFVKPIDEYHLFVNDRKVHVENLIKPALKQKKIVILDRYYFSNIAYQGSLGLNPEKIKAENESFAPIPEIVFLLKVPPRVGLRRIQKGRNEEPNLFEREENLTKVSQIFDSLAEKYIVPIDGIENIEDIHKTIKNVMDDIVDHYLSKEEQYTLFNKKVEIV